MFVPEVQPVWQECQRVLRPGGRLMAGFCNPIRYLFDFDLLEQDKFEVKYSLPYSDLTHLSEAERQRLVDDKQPLEFGHTLDSLIGGQLAAGFVITGFYEDRWQGQARSAHCLHCDMCLRFENYEFRLWIENLC